MVRVEIRARKIGWKARQGGPGGQFVEKPINFANGQIWTNRILTVAGARVVLSKRPEVCLKRGPVAEGLFLKLPGLFWRKSQSHSHFSLPFNSM